MDDTPDYSGGTATDSHRVPLTGALTLSSGSIRIKKISSCPNGGRRNHVTPLPRCARVRYPGTGMSAVFDIADHAASGVDVSIVMPCLDEARTLPVCLERAREALEELARRHGLRGEIVVADNGSRDGGQAIVVAAGARVAAVARRGYGAALIGGLTAARGRFLVMADADGSYDFRQAVPMVESLLEGNDLCMGSRFRGTIEPGAMPWKNRYIGNPILTGVLNFLFKSGVSDAHCGLRAIRKEAFLRLGLRAPGMEFASEMVIKAALLGLRISEVPITLSPDGRDRAPHLRPWRDGWRHLRYLLMLSPVGLYLIPAAVLGAIALTIFTMLILKTDQVMVQLGPFRFGDHWMVVSAGLLAVCQQAVVFGLATLLHGIREGYRKPTPLLMAVFRFSRLEYVLAAGVGLLGLGVVFLGDVMVSWSGQGFGALAEMRVMIAAMTMLVLGFQTVFGGFLLSIIGGNDADPAAAASVAATGEPGP